MKKLLIAAIVASSLGSVALPALSADIIIRNGPPPMKVERVPAARHGYAWVPGYWDWKGRGYVWVKGTYVRERPGYVYRAPVWEQHDGRWQKSGGDWGHGDNDHDGVPNRADDHPNNPRRN